MATRIHPMPTEAIMLCPTLQTAPGPVYRATLCIAVAYWQAGCSLPLTDDVTLSSICRLPFPHFRPIKALVLKALAQITPELDAAHAKVQAVYEAQTRTAQTMRDRQSVIRAKRSLERLSQPREQTMQFDHAAKGSPKDNHPNIPTHILAKGQRPTAEKDDAVFRD